jgi:hypothetical protein
VGQSHTPDRCLAHHASDNGGCCVGEWPANAAFRPETTMIKLPQNQLIGNGDLLLNPGFGLEVTRLDANTVAVQSAFRPTGFGIRDRNHRHGWHDESVPSLGDLVPPSGSNQTFSGLRLPVSVLRRQKPSCW